MKLIVLDYEYGTVQVVKSIPDDIDDYENFVYNILGYKDSDISWILLEDDSQIISYTYANGKKNYDNENLINNG